MSKLQKLARLSGHALRLAVTRPHRLSHLLGCALAAAEEVADPELDLLRLPGVTVEELLPPSGVPRAQLALFPPTGASVSVLEWVALILLLRKAEARRIFEFGTYKGVSITQLALNLPADSEIYTLDLPDDDPRSAFIITDQEDIDIAQESGKGALVPADVRDRIHFLRQDSATFDATPMEGRMDFIFVDGAHNDAYVRNDSEKAWRMLRSGGIVAWHDCRVADPAVVRYLVASPFNPRRIAGTSLAFARKP